MRIDTIEGIGPNNAAKLAEQGVRTVEKLLSECAQRRGREKLAKQTGISEKTLLKWTNLADLMRVRGIGAEYSELLEAAGVDTVRELASRRPENLHQSVVAANEKNRLVCRMPTLSQIQKWVNQAKKLSPILSY